MRVAEVVGRVTLRTSHPSLRRGALVVTLPITSAALLEDAPTRGEEVVAFDELGAGVGAVVGLSEGREAANPFGKTKVPVDAYVACVLDSINL